MLVEHRNAEVAARLKDVVARNARFFDKAVLKLVRWNKDLKLSLEHDLKEMDKQLREPRRSAALAQSVNDKLAHQTQKRELERRGNAKRRELFGAHEVVDRQRED